MLCFCHALGAAGVDKSLQTEVIHVTISVCMSSDSREGAGGHEGGETDRGALRCGQHELVRGDEACFGVRDTRRRSWRKTCVGSRAAFTSQSLLLLMGERPQECRRGCVPCDALGCVQCCVSTVVWVGPVGAWGLLPATSYVRGGTAGGFGWCRVVAVSARFSRHTVQHGSNPVIGQHGWTRSTAPLTQTPFHVTTLRAVTSPGPVCLTRQAHSLMARGLGLAQPAAPAPTAHHSTGWAGQLHADPSSTTARWGQFRDSAPTAAAATHPTQGLAHPVCHTDRACMPSTWLIAASSTESSGSGGPTHKRISTAVTPARLDRGMPCRITAADDLQIRQHAVRVEQHQPQPAW